CDHVLGQSGWEQRLDQLQATKRIVIPLDRNGESYRMHRLLRDVLEAELDRAEPTARTQVERRASEGHEREGDVDRAIHHALRAGDLANAERLVTEHAPVFQTSGRAATVGRWLDAFPREYVLGSVPLCLCGAGATIGLGESDASAAWIRFGEQALERNPEPD